MKKLPASVPSFAQDTTAVERQVMQAHADYWKELAERELVGVFGAVLDPEGVWGAAIVAVANEAQVNELIADDPVKRPSSAPSRSSQCRSAPCGPTCSNRRDDERPPSRGPRAVK
ncbi:MAG: YciI family protein [Gemmatimonadota bacterium]